MPDVALAHALQSGPFVTPHFHRHNRPRVTGEIGTDRAMVQGCAATSSTCHICAKESLLSRGDLPRGPDADLETRTRRLAAPRNSSTRCFVVGLTRIELVTSALSGQRSNRLSYSPSKDARLPAATPILN